MGHIVGSIKQMVSPHGRHQWPQLQILNSVGAELKLVHCLVVGLVLEGGEADLVDHNGGLNIGLGIMRQRGDEVILVLVEGG